MPLSLAEHDEIVGAIAAAEKRTSGEIYCVLADEASDYREVPIAYGALAALVLPPLLLLFGGGPAMDWRAAHLAAAQGEFGAWALVLIVAQGALFALTAWVVSFPAVRRALTPARVKRDRVRQRAMAQFLAKGMQRTKDRTGVLIFVALAEHMAELIADEGIHQKVEEGAWEAPMQALVKAIGEGGAARGFVAAIEQCGAILAARLPAQREDVNELPDAFIELPRL